MKGIVSIHCTYSLHTFLDFKIIMKYTISEFLGKTGALMDVWIYELTDKQFDHDSFYHLAQIKRAIVNRRFISLRL